MICHVGPTGHATWHRNVLAWGAPQMPAEGGRLHVMSLGEMAQANRLLATEAEPAHIGELRRAAPALYVESHGEPEITVTRERLTAGEGKSVWRVGLCSPGGSALPGMLVLRADRVHVSELV